MDRDPIDPKNLIRESYRIEGIDAGQCRSIFLDWALSLPDTEDTQDAIAQHLAHYGTDNPDHPMTTVLREGQATAARPKRRGGWRSRERGDV